MAKVKCEYCGYYIDDTEETCSRCGAANAHHRRTTNDTPQTIEQLQSWYIARGLPPEDVTRFFIGKNIQEPKAFGIYEEHGEFIVYKNKADGSRAIRYKGRDEAYAVNELYLRLKEEILNQKNINIRNRQRESSISRTNRTTYNTNKKKPNKIVTILLVIFGIQFIIPILLSCLVLFNFSTITNSSSHTYNYYMNDAGDIYYCEGYEDGGYRWWEYDVNTKKWSIYTSYESSEEMPPNISNSDKYDYVSDLAEKLGIEYNDIDIYHSKEYIDEDNHFAPSSSYYFYDGKLYYYLNDKYGSDYGSGDNSGWYQYNDNGSWEYYCSSDDKDKLGDDLWYYDDDYSAGSTIDSALYYIDGMPTSWNPVGFETTNWYKEYESSKSAYDDYWDNHQSSYDDDDDSWWDSDSDYDWDSGDSWDSGGSDWDSDW